jgi:glycosyltransferase involved in cell wall biosynthesis
MYPSPENPAHGIFVEEQAASLRRAGCEVDVLVVEGPPKLKYALAVPRIRARLRRARYDVVHAHHVYCGAAALAAAETPVVVTLHGAELTGRNRLARWLCRAVASRAAAVIVVSEEMRRILGGRAEVIPCGVDLAAFRPRGREACREELGLPRDARLALFSGFFAGTPRRLKRVDLAVAAVERARRDLGDVRLWMVGRVPHERMPIHIGASDAVLLTSDAEGSPMIVKESLACGVPVVSVPVGDVPEIAERSPGCLLARRDADDLARRLVEACRLPAAAVDGAWKASISLESVAERVAAVYRRAARC